MSFSFLKISMQPEKILQTILGFWWIKAQHIFISTMCIVHIPKCENKLKLEFLFHIEASNQILVIGKFDELAEQ